MTRKTGLAPSSRSPEQTGDGINPVVPFTRTPGRTGSVLSTWYSWSRPGLYQDTWQYPGRDQVYQVDGTDPVLLGVLVNGTTGVDTWSRLF